MQYVHKFPRRFALSGSNSKRYFDKEGNLRKIPEVKFKALEEVLIEK